MVTKRLVVLVPLSEERRARSRYLIRFAHGDSCRDQASAGAEACEGVVVVPQILRESPDRLPAAGHERRCRAVRPFGGRTRGEAGMLARVENGPADGQEREEVAESQRESAIVVRDVEVLDERVLRCSLRRFSER